MIIDVVTNQDRFRLLRDEWDDLLARSPLDSFFLTHEWLYSWWEHFGGRYDLAIATCRADGTRQLVGLFPAYCRLLSSIPRVGSLRFLGSDSVTSDFLEPIVAHGYEPNVYDLYFRWLRERATDYGVAELTDMLQDSAFHRHLATTDVGDLPMFVSDPCKVCPQLALPRSYDTLLASMSAMARRNARRYRNYLNRTAVVELERIDDQHRLQQAWPDLVRLHQGRKNAVGLPGRFSSRAYDAFHQSVCSRALPLGRLRLEFLKVNGSRVAFFYSFSFRGHLSIYQSGLDLEWSRASVGSVLLGYVIERAILEGHSHVEFLRGGEGYKYDWGAQNRHLVDLAIYGRTLAGRFHRCRRRAANGLHLWKTASSPGRLLATALRHATRIGRHT